MVLSGRGGTEPLGEGRRGYVAHGGLFSAHEGA